MKLTTAVSSDGYQLWGVYLDGRRNDGDGGIEINHVWFMVARSQSAVREALAETVEQTIRKYTHWYTPPTVTYRPVSPGDLTVCYRGPGGKLKPVELDAKSTIDFIVTSALMDTRE